MAHSIAMEEVEDVILELLAAARPGRSISPEEVARALDDENWRQRLPQVRAAAQALARAGRLAILRRGKVVNPEELRGVWRLGAVG